MAITKSKSVQRLEVYPPADTSADDAHNAKHESVMVVYENLMDDPNDDDLPEWQLKLFIFINLLKMMAMLQIIQAKMLLLCLSVMQSGVHNCQVTLQI